MIESDARRWMIEHFSAEATARVAIFVAAVIAENEQQNLVSPATIGSMWARHVVDSAQLLHLAPDSWRTWLDVGTGGGFPGMIVAILAPDKSVVMCEPRTKRAAFLDKSAQNLGLANAKVVAAKVGAVEAISDVISARAVAPVEKLLRGAAHCSTSTTTWLLPRGRSGAGDLGHHSRMFHVEHSITDGGSTILVGRGSLR